MDYIGKVYFCVSIQKESGVWKLEMEMKNMVLAWLFLVVHLTWAASPRKALFRDVTQ